MQACEARKQPEPKPKSEEEVDVNLYEDLADVANQNNVFTRDIDGADLLHFREGKLEKPLHALKMVRAAFFLSLMAGYKLMPRDWKAKAEKGKLLAYTNGKVPSASYLRASASRSDVKDYLDIKPPVIKLIRLKWKSEIALRMKEAVMRRK